MGAAFTAASACARYEWIPDYETAYCRNRVMPAKPVAFRRVAGDTAEIALQGTVESQQGDRLPAAHIRLTLGLDTLHVSSDADGSFRLDAPQAGQYTIRVARIGFVSVQDTLSLPLARGEQLRVVLDESPLDGPRSGFANVRVKKAWWKFW
jgi:hypothetical protein